MVTYAFIIILGGAQFVEDSGLTAEDCAARIVTYSEQVTAPMVCAPEPLGD